MCPMVVILEIGAYLRRQAVVKVGKVTRDPALMASLSVARVGENRGVVEGDAFGSGWSVNNAFHCVRSSWCDAKCPQFVCFFVCLLYTAHDDFTAMESTQFIFGEVCGASSLAQLADGEGEATCKIVEDVDLCHGCWKIGDVEVSGVSGLHCGVV